MLKSSARSVIPLRGVRHNNLKNFDLDLPLNRLIVITGLSGSGKSSLAFDTLFAEGQRRYIETFSPYARQFFDRMDKPQVDSIEGIPPAIAIEQRNAVKTTRSTVGTMTEICDYMKSLWSHLAQLHCRQCHQPVRKDTPQQIWQTLRDPAPRDHPPERIPKRDQTVVPAQDLEVLITFDLPLSERLSLEESLALVAKQGYQRLLVQGEVVQLGASGSENPLRGGGAQSRLTSLTVIQDRLRLTDANRARFVECCEQAYHYGKGKLAIQEFDPATQEIRATHRFSNQLHCARCDIEYREPSPALFSFNHPVGACPTCRGFGRIISIDYDRAVPDRSKTIAQGVVKPWQTGLGAECQDDLLRMCHKFGAPTDVPFNELPKKWQAFVIDGEPGYGKDSSHQWPHAWYGVKGYFRWLESKAYKMHVRVLLSRYRAYTTCPDCHGKRFQPDALLYTARGTAGEALTLADFYQLPVRDALPFIDTLVEPLRLRRNNPLGLVLGEVRSRLRYLNDVGLGYLSLDRPTRSLSGGETERVNLTTCLGTRLVNTLFVLDEPSVGLHPRDTDRLVRLLEQLRDAGNTVVVVEHEAAMMRAADQIIDLGPGHGATGGQVVFQGPCARILRAPRSLTGQYLSGRKQIEIPRRRPAGTMQLSGVRGNGSSRSANAQIGGNGASGRSSVAGAALKITHATRHNLKDLSVEIPLGRFVCVTGVSGSGKTTLVREVLLPALAEKLESEQTDAKASDRLNTDDESENEDAESRSGTAPSAQLQGAHHLDRVILVDQSILAKTPRSNPAVYIGAFDDIREVFAQTEIARQRGLSASAFSFNSAQGQCERCRGAGFEKIEMQFLSDVFIRCPDCDGRRYRPHILEVKIRAEPPSTSPAFSIADLLEATVEEATALLSAFNGSRPAQRAVQSLRLLEEVGLGYLRLGQPINTLSGGESQRLKLVRHLAEVVVGNDIPSRATRAAQAKSLVAQNRVEPKPIAAKTTLFLFDEPTTGLHFDDVRVLLKVFQRLVNAGHSVVVIEHNLDVVKSADWIIDLGPDAGDQGGQIVAAGTPEEIAACKQSHTGQALRQVLRSRTTSLPSLQISPRQ
jgi:excinuclease ABC subunit A